MTTEHESEAAAQASEAPKKNRHVTVALNHLIERRDALVQQRDKIVTQIEQLDAAISALE